MIGVQDGLRPVSVLVPVTFQDLCGSVQFGAATASPKSY